MDNVDSIDSYFPQGKKRILALVWMVTLGFITNMLKYKLLNVYYRFTVPLQLIPLVANGYQEFQF